MINYTIKPNGGGDYSSIQAFINALNITQTDNITGTFAEDIYHLENTDWINANKSNRTHAGFYVILDGIGTGAGGARALIDSINGSDIIFDVQSCENIQIKNWETYDVGSAIHWDFIYFHENTDCHMVNCIGHGGNAGTFFYTISSSLRTRVLNCIANQDASAGGVSVVLGARTDRNSGNSADNYFFNCAFYAGIGNGMIPIQWDQGHSTVGHNVRPKMFNCILETNRTLTPCMLFESTNNGLSNDDPELDYNLYIRRPSGWSVTDDQAPTTDQDIINFYGTTYSSLATYQSATGQDANSKEIGPIVGSVRTGNHQLFYGHGLPNGNPLNLVGKDISSYNITVGGDAILECDKDIFGNTRSSYTIGPAEGPATADTTNPTTGAILTAVNPSEGGVIDLTWAVATDAGGMNKYNVYYSTTQGNVFSDGVKQCFPFGTNAGQIGGLTNGTVYYFGVRAEDDAQNEESNTTTKSATPSAPATIDPEPNIEAILVDDDSIFEAFLVEC